MLQVINLNSYYDKVHVLHDISFELKKGEISVVLGRNGAGKTTLLKSIIGLIRNKSGKIIIDGQDISNLPSYKIVQLGVGYVPQEQRVFPELTVMENLRVGMGKLFNEEKLKNVLELIPQLKDMLNRVAGNLSGGEQQMVSIARALIRSPKLLLLDEPFAGLMPGLSKKLAEFFKSLTEEGITVLLTEARVVEWLNVCNNAIILEQGKIRHKSPFEKLLSDPEILVATLGVARLER